MDSAKPAFFLESGSLALDLLNTGAAADDEPPERLRGPLELVSWLDTVGLGESAPTDPTVLRILLTEARHLRDDILRLVTSTRRGEPPPSHAVYGINRVLEASRTSVSLQMDGGEGRLVPREHGKAPLVVLAPVARAAAALLVASDPARIRRCASETCGRWFLDTSKGGRRKWCSMATCGNRAKAEAHRKRHAVV